MKIWQFLIETNLINFCIFAGIVYFMASRMLEQNWSAKNAEINDRLAQSLAEKELAEKKLAEANARFETFQRELSEIEASHETIIKNLTESLNKENQQKVSNIKQKYEREIARLKSQAIQEVSQKSMDMAVEMIRETLAQQNTKQVEIHNNSLNRVSH